MRSNCLSCDIALRERFAWTFQQLQCLIDELPSERKKERAIQVHCSYYEDAHKTFIQGKHFGPPDCPGYEHWDKLLREFERRFHLVGRKQWGQIEFDIIQAFFQLPFWKERDRLYEVWTLVHFLSLFYGVAIRLQIKDNQWRLFYGVSTEPVAWIQGNNFVIEVWYQRKLTVDLGAFFDEPIEPEMLFSLKEGTKKAEPLLLIECKDRFRYSDREAKILAAFYGAQVPTKLNIFCNYLDFESGKSLQSYTDKIHTLFCARFRPGGPSVSQVDQEFLTFWRDQLRLFLTSILIDQSQEMKNKDVLFVYLRLVNLIISSSSLITGQCGFFAEQTICCSYEDLLENLKQVHQIGKLAHLQIAVKTLEHENQKLLGKETKLTIFVITNCVFHPSDWSWLQREIPATVNLVLVVRRGWLTEEKLRKIEQCKNVTPLFF